jgi:hypothetical protein
VLHSVCKNQDMACCTVHRHITKQQCTQEHAQLHALISTLVSPRAPHRNLFRCAGCTATNATTITCTIASLAGNTNSTLPIVVRPTAAGPLTTQAVVTAPGESNPTNNGPASITVNVVRTCALYKANGTGFACGAGSIVNTNNSQSTSPSSGTCCVSGLRECICFADVFA